MIKRVSQLVDLDDRIRACCLPVPPPSPPLARLTHPLKRRYEPAAVAGRQPLKQQKALELCISSEAAFAAGVPDDGEACQYGLQDEGQLMLFLALLVLLLRCVTCQTP